MNRLWIIGAIVLVAATLSVGGCDEDAKDGVAPPTPTSPSPAAKGEETIPSPASVLAPRQPPATRALRDAIAHRQAARMAAVETTSQLINQDIRQQGPFARLLQQAYAKRPGKLFFHANGAPTADRDGVWELVRHVSDEALSPKPYRVERLRELMRGVEQREKALLPLERCEGFGPTQTTLCRLVLDAAAVPTLGESARLLTDAGLADAPADLIGFAEEITSRLAEKEIALRASRTELDVLLLRAFFQYVLDFRVLKRAHPDLAVKDDGEGPVEHRAVLLAHLDRAGDDLTGHLRALRPANPIYERTVAALRRYRAFVAAGGFDKLERGRVRRGKRSPAVRKLKKRLKLERYYDGPVDDRADDSFTEALRLYQRTHQLEEDGKPGRALYKSLNIPAERRVRSIELSLQRWRESAIRAGLPLYVRVNIPQFEAEFWEGDKVVRRHRVIVGRNAIDRNLIAGIEGRLNHTRLFEAELSTVVLNPTWTVPLRIKKYELDRELLKNPNYYEDNNFELKETKSGRVIVRQGPGPNNALGRVKFLFPNDYAIYMHDTPKRSLFKRTYRAFSHGCIRTHRPIELAKWLLKRINGMTGEQVDRILRRGKERAINLAKKVPLFIEYNTVTVDEAGRVSFFNDVYRYDRAYWRGELPFERSHKIGPERLLKLRADEEVFQTELETILSDPGAATGDAATGDAAPASTTAPAPTPAAPTPNGGKTE